MSTTLTIRTNDALRRALDDRAKALGIGVSELVRSILREALATRNLGERTAELRGRLKLVSRPDDALRARTRRRNWRT